MVAFSGQLSYRIPMFSASFCQGEHMTNVLSLPFSHAFNSATFLSWPLQCKLLFFFLSSLSILPNKRFLLRDHKGVAQWDITLKKPKPNLH
jgi:hypothetical protein